LGCGISVKKLSERRDGESVRTKFETYLEKRLGGGFRRPKVGGKT